MNTENRPAVMARAMSVAEVERTASPAQPVLHTGTPYVKGPAAYVEKHDTDIGEPRHSPSAVLTKEHWDPLMIWTGTGFRRATEEEQAAHDAKKKPLTFADFPAAGGCSPPPPGRNAAADCVLPNDPGARKKIPAAAVLDYFDAAIVEIAKALQAGNDEHNPGEDLHWARGKSPDQDHALIRHFLERGTVYVDRNGVVVRHSTSLAIRALMLLQIELEATGAPMSRGSRPAST